MLSKNKSMWRRSFVGALFCLTLLSGTVAAQEPLPA